MLRFTGAVLAMLGFIVSADLVAQGAATVFSSQQVHGALRALAPTGVLVDAVKLDAVGPDAARATAEGSADTSEQVSQFMRRIDAAPELEAPELLSIANANGRMAYSVAVTVRCPEGAVGSGPGLCGSTPSKPKSVYKCRINGTITFQAAACPPGQDA